MERVVAAVGIAIGVMVGGGIVAYVVYVVWAIKYGWRGWDNH